LQQEATLERRAAEKAQKALEREEKRHQKEQKDQKKALLTLKRKKERELRKDLTVSLKKARPSNARTRRPSIRSSKALNQPTNPISRAIQTTTRPQATPPCLNTADTSTIAGTIDLTVAEALNTNRRGRRVALPQRFRE
jgi:hypothetical protein